MSNSNDTAAKLTLKIAGAYQEVRDAWTKRVDSYFDQLESLVAGEWFESSDLTGIIIEAKSAAREALIGLGNDLSAELVHATGGVVSRFEAERFSLIEELADLRNTLSRVLESDEEGIRQENESLRYAIRTVPEYKLLNVIRKLNRASYTEIAKASGLKKGKVTNYVKLLMARGHVQVNKKTRPHSVVFLSAPWKNNPIDQPGDTSISTPKRETMLTW
ncbi:MAG: winged helix-turn-helix transcriptional regulator [Candidatus Thorarchaeota archaeon]|jgi:DNA-binding MarR family transcriptional regulator